MKRVTASQARKNWFRFLDEVVDGETIVMERRSVRILLKRDPQVPGERYKPAPDYSRCLRVPHVDQADQWRWDWTPDMPDTIPEDDISR